MSPDSEARIAARPARTIAPPSRTGMTTVVRGGCTLSCDGAWARSVAEANGSSGLPGRSLPSGPRMWIRPGVGGSSCRVRWIRRGRMRGPRSAMGSGASLATNARCSPVVALPRVKVGGVSGSPGCQAQPRMPPSFSSTQPSVHRIAAIRIGLPSRSSPFWRTVKRRPPCQPVGRRCWRKGWPSRAIRSAPGFAG